MPLLFMNVFIIIVQVLVGLYQAYTEIILGMDVYYENLFSSAHIQMLMANCL